MEVGPKMFMYCVELWGQPGVDAFASLLPSLGLISVANFTHYLKHSQFYKYMRLVCTQECAVYWHLHQLHFIILYFC